MASITYEGATRVYSEGHAPALDQLDLQVQDGEFMVLVGPSGSGKSTALRMLAGLEQVDGGTIRVGDAEVTHVPSRDRDLAMVFQNYALYPHMTVAENIGFHLRIAKVPKAEARRRVTEAAKMLDLDPYLERRPKQLSGGQRQRVAMGRAIVREPRAFLMDEPLSNLDAKLRVSTRAQIAALQRRLAVTTIYVTHDQVEAMTMGDRVAVLRDGTLQQCDTPRGLFDRPANVFVAGFIGSPTMNLFTVRADGEALPFGSTALPLTREQRAALTGDDVVVGLRSEALSLVAAGSPEGVVSMVVDVVEELGADAFLYGTVQLTPQSDPVATAVRCAPQVVPPRGASVSLAVDRDAVHLFDAASGLRLPA
jgi:multiple sugar transport system ATP-binding protein